ncbi:uncharacterized protein FOMMEDRAFT_30446 [Fomitiporia mediterranea MF3/22]|uniref:uncharacterized protein n=1 Tax=Fomitiporia mediterranea (strain MF3/22) TaxID=694068 RepID=UPI000440757B|nr:uncharacterized protein FOMMEDRAFT_30446 [Fomitiporia mediterranea MF3/22]EJD00384.1 hypothetical protein FOMMEDRAFT_30446 [Fomitiporia mediterranea MF3/22]
MLVFNLFSKWSAFIHFVTAGPILPSLVSDQQTALINIVITAILSNYKFYVEGNVPSLLLCSTVTMFGIVLSSFAICYGGRGGREVPIYPKLFTTTSVLLKLLVDSSKSVNGDSNTLTIWTILQDTFGIQSFIFSATALWFIASGTQVLSPFVSSSYRLNTANRGPLAVSVLFWMGFYLFIAGAFITIAISPTDLGGIVLVAFVVFAICVVNHYYNSTQEFGRQQQRLP